MTPRTRYALLGVGGLALAVAVGLLLALVLRSVNSPAVSAPQVPPTTSAPAPVAPAPSEPPAAPAPAPA